MIFQINKEDLVDHITQAAQKLIKDPNSYYHNLKKDEKASISQMIGNEEEKNRTGEFPKVNNEINIAKYSNQEKAMPIQPYPRTKNSPQKKDSSK